MTFRAALWCCFLLPACAGTATHRGDTVVYASGADLQSMNSLITTHPLARQVQRYVLLTTLVRYDSALQPEPYLARRWEWSRDSMMLTFHLFPRLRWSDGAPTTATDAAWTITTARDPATGYPRWTDVARIVSAVGRDDSTLVLRFDRPQPRIPDVLTDLAILPHHLLDTVPDNAMRRASWNQHPIGNGPFVFVSHAPNRRWVFQANPAFPEELGGPPQVQRLVIAVVDEPSTKLAALTSGELDFAGIQPAHAAFVRADSALQLVRYPLMLTYAVVFNTRRAPFTDRHARQAVSLALDRRSIVDGYLFGFGTPASGPVALPADTNAPRPDPARARQLLAGRPLQFELITVGSGEAALEQMIQTQLAVAGVRVTIRQLELTAFLDRLNGRAHDFDAAVLGITGDAGLGQLAPLLTTAGIAATGEGAALLPIFADSMPAAFLYHAGGVQGMNRRMLGVHMDVRGELASLHDWQVKP